MPLRRRQRSFPVYHVVRATLATLFVAGLVVLLAYCAAILLIDPNGYKPQIEAAVKQATGRTLVLRGPMRLGFGLPPWLIAEDVTLSNPGGLSRADMATLQRAEARVAVWPLLTGHIELIDLTLIHPDVLLERDADGRGNWLLGAAPAPTDQPTTPAAPAATADESDGQVAPPPVSQLGMGRHSRPRLGVQSLHIVEGRIGWRPRPDAPTVQLTIPRLDADASGPGGTMLLSGTVAGAGRPLRLSGEVGSLDRLFDRWAMVPWPVQVTLKDAGARLAVSGSVAEPMRGRGLALTVDAAITDFTGLAPFLPPDLPPPHDATASVQWGDGKADSNAGLAGISLHIDGLRLPGLLPSLQIGHLDLGAPGLDRPVHLDMEGTSPATGTLRLVANAASLGAILPDAHPEHPVPIDVTLDAGQALISAKGTLAEPAALKGADLDMFVRLPDVAAIGTLVNRKLPPLSQVSFEGRVVGDLTLAGAIGVRAATLTLPEATLSGDADIRPGPRPYIHAAISSQHIDLDALLGALTQATAAAPAAAAPAAPAVAATARHWLIPDTPIDFAPLDRVDADVQFRVDALQVAGIGYTQVGGRMLMHDGQLTIDPLSGTMPGGVAEMRLSVNSRAAEPAVTLHVRAPSVQLAALAPLLGDGIAAAGTFGIDADLQGAGHTLHAIAGTLDGHLGLASVDSDLDNRLLLRLVKAARLPAVPANVAGTTRLRCLAVRLDATAGVATVRALVADAQRVAVAGGGTLDFGQEQLALQLRPLLRLGGSAASGVVLPVHVGGSFLDPRVTSEAGGKGGPPITGAGVADPCTPALAIVYGPGGGKPKPAAASTVAAAKPEPVRPPSTIDVLKQLIK